MDSLFFTCAVNVKILGCKTSSSSLSLSYLVLHMPLPCSCVPATFVSCELPTRSFVIYSFVIKTPRTSYNDCFYKCKFNKRELRYQQHLLEILPVMSNVVDLYDTAFIGLPKKTLYKMNIEEEQIDMCLVLNGFVRWKSLDL